MAQSFNALGMVDEASDEAYALSMLTCPLLLALPDFLHRGGVLNAARNKSSGGSKAEEEKRNTKVRRQGHVPRMLATSLTQLGLNGNGQWLRNKAAGYVLTSGSVRRDVYVLQIRTCYPAVCCCSAGGDICPLGIPVCTQTLF